MGLLDAIKQELHWDNGIKIPLANSSNKLLETEVSMRQYSASAIKQKK